LGGIAMVGLGVYFVASGLDRADKLASAIGLFVGLLGLAVSLYGTLLARRSHPQQGGQSISGSQVGGEVLRVHDVRGNVRIGPAGTRSSGNPPAAIPLSSRLGEGTGSQSVSGSTISGPVRDVGNIGGDADIDR
jgi:hypothetical protein